MTDSTVLSIETMALANTAAIVSIAAVNFDSNQPDCGSTEHFYTELDWMNQGRRRDRSTWKYWMEQSDKAKSALKGKTRLSTALVSLNEFIGHKTDIWALLPFDIPVLTTAYAQCKLNPPWGHWNLCDVRTIKRLYEMKRCGLSTSVTQGETALEKALHKVDIICKGVDTLTDGEW